MRTVLGRMLWMCLYLVIVGGACTQVPTSPINTDSEQAVLGEPTIKSLPSSATHTKTLEPTATPTSTLTPSVTPAPQIRVSENTNCRSGAGASFPFRGVLNVGEVAQVLARSTLPDFWYVSNPSVADEGCWLWGEFAEVMGEIDALPVYTPAPSPTPQVGFDVFLKSFERCQSIFYVVFAVKNTGGDRIWSGYVEVQDFNSHSTLYSASERHPFAATVNPVCPPDHGNELWPGETRYIHVPLSSAKSGSTAAAIITLCTADHQGGTCLTEYSYFEIP